MDIILPDMCGLEATRIIKSDPDLASIFVINMSSHLTSREHQKNGLDAGADGYITRPISNQELLISVNAFLRLKTMLDALRESEQQVRSIIEQNNDGMMIVNQEKRILFSNPSAAKLIACSNEQLKGRRFTWIDLSDRPTPVEIEVNLANPDKRKATLEVRASTLVWEGEPAFLITLHDVTRRKATEQRIHQLAFFDELTDLPNRFLFMDRLKLALSMAERSGIVGALVFLDLDNFKLLNDTHGHALGDKLLKQVGIRMSSCVRESDTVARLGGDEFVILLCELHECPVEAAKLAEIACQKILDTFKTPFKLGQHQHFITPSLGIALFSDAPITVDELMKQADLSMYQAKAAGRNTLRFFDPQMQLAVSRRIKLESELRDALTHNAFFVHYQPQINCDYLVTGAEALVRWQHPHRGVILPYEFLDLAEETGLILPLGKLVLEGVCKQLAVWKKIPQLAQLTLAVNISCRQFHHPDFLSIVEDVLASSGANPNNLKLELSEKLLLENMEDTLFKMKSLHARGVQFSLDDFGTGYASMAYLKHLPIEQLKIDRSFIKELAKSRCDMAIARSIMSLAYSLDLAVIAEGVETKEQHRLLLQEGCKAFQGNLFCRSVPADQLELLVNA